MATTIESPSAEFDNINGGVLEITHENDIADNANAPENEVVSTPSALPEEHIRPYSSRDPATIERANLLNICKLVVKEVIASSLKYGRMLDDAHAPLQQFFIVLEHVLRHRIKPKKGILRDRRDFWSVLEQVERYSADATDITTSVKQMSHIRTAQGRGRAWLRLALMQKKLADYFRLLLDKRELLEFYEEGALMLGEECVEISGLLVGLNIIDCNMGIKDEDLDQPLGVIDFSLYMQDRLKILSPGDDSPEETQMAAILDQKNYLEELNTHLNATVTNLQLKLESTLTANTLMKEDLAISKNSLLALQTECTSLRSERDELLEAHRRQLQTAHEDMATEREVYETSRSGLDNMYSELRKSLKDETNMRMDCEKELELQISMKQEVEMALRLLEKDIHEKQDSVIALRKQLDEVKVINIDMYNKLQSCEATLKYKNELVLKLEEKSSQMNSLIVEMENSLKQSRSDKLAAEETARKVGQQLADKDIKRCALETDVRIEREWRTSLQKNIDQQKLNITQLNRELQELNATKKEYISLQERHLHLQRTCDEQEQALAELGCHLSESKLKVEDLREEKQQSQRDLQWTVDKEVVNCMQCEKPFSVARRKHHCRNCGEIFCNECSDNKMRLPSSAKPERVCDSCHTLLLQRFTAT